MLFNSFTYLVFLPIVVALHWVLPERFRRALLLIASYIFYMNWMPAYGSLILGLTVANYFFGLAIAWAKTNDGGQFAGAMQRVARAGRCPSPTVEDSHRRGRGILIASLIFNIGCLCFYKYANFLVSSAWQIAFWGHNWCNVPATVSAQSPVLNIILPLGISFFTFEFIHYTVDIYRGSTPIRNFFHFALFAAFFPSQIAGPIKRFQDFNQQLAKKAQFNGELFKQGCSLIFLGLFKKMVLSDNLGQVVAVGFSHPRDMGTIDAWLAATAFTIQIYLDFSGYTDIGRGSALMLGYKLPPNFNWPFLSASLNEFWRRWHISLSTWLRDYLFIPMGGSRVSAMKVKRNLFITMALGGLWHGADWHYVIWGLFHGTGLVLTKDWLDLVDRTPWLNRLRAFSWWHWSGVACTFVFLIFAGVVFRAENVPKAVEIFSRMFTLAASANVIESFAVSTLPISVTVYCCFLALEQMSAKQMFKGNAIIGTVQSLWQKSIAARAVSYAAVGLVILGFSPEHVAPFIYFQF
jgi:D-alanyl-lipoteichoic acid acyltransferase DltB (MBOAT superfamily)